MQVATCSQGTTVGNQPKGSKSFPSYTRPHGPSLPLNHAKLPKTGRENQQLPSKPSRVPLSNASVSFSQHHHPLPYDHKDLPTTCYHSRPSTQFEILPHQSHPPSTMPVIGNTRMKSQYDLESAIAIGPPCVMPSPQYLLIDSKRVEKASQTQTESLNHSQSKESSTVVRPLVQDDQDLYIKPSTADACLQTSLNSTSKTHDSVECYQVDDLNCGAMEIAQPNEQVSVHEL